MTGKKLKLYGVPMSQPFRSCAWLMLQLKVPFQIEMAVPGMSGKVGTKNEQFRSLTPHRSTTVPLLVDDNMSLVLSESPAIMTYLCEQYGSDDNGQPLYAAPGSNQKALIDSYMHWHHGNTRFLARLFQAKVRPDLMVELDDDDNSRIQEVLENIDKGWLQTSPFIGTSEKPSIADILAYGELSTVTMTNLLCIDEFGNLSSWMGRMKQLPYHEECHVALTSLGDLSIDSDVPISKRLGPATKVGLKALVDTQESVTSQ
jgi:glutathione S-transferase